MATRREDVKSGWDVYGSDGEKVGQVDEVGPDYLLVVKGFFFQRDMYIPLSAVAAAANGAVRLNVTKQQANSRGWEKRPAAHAEAAQRTRHAERPAGESRPAARDIRVPIAEEELVARKHAQEVGAVEVTKEVVEEQKTLEVPVSREEVRVERVDADRPLKPDETAFEGGTVRVPIVEETVSAEKQTHVVGEFVISTEVVQETAEVSGTVRKEDVRVHRTGQGDWEAASGAYRADWERGGAGPWEDVEPAYRFGHETGGDPRYQSLSFERAEPSLKRDWESRGHESAWHRVRDHVRDAWRHRTARH